jgi:hypothetical protein
MNLNYNAFREIILSDRIYGGQTLPEAGLQKWGK